jgi:AraC family transcriptional regulator
MRSPFIEEAYGYSEATGLRLGKVAIFHPMTLTASQLASGAGWRVRSLMCTAGPKDPRLEERHMSICIAAVTEGSFQYRTSQGSALLVPGALLLGNGGSFFECRHDHGIGDHCLSFHYDPEYFDEILTNVNGARRLDFTLPRLPPSSALAPYLAAAESAVTDPAALEEIALALAGVVVATLAEAKKKRLSTTPRDERRIVETVRTLKSRIAEPLALPDLADEAEMSRYHFLRVFRKVVGATPHQFVLATRLRLAMIRLRRTDEPVSAIAYDVGFGDLPEFTRRFLRFAGVTPSVFRSLPQR